MKPRNFINISDKRDTKIPYVKLAAQILEAARKLFINNSDLQITALHGGSVWVNTRALLTGSVEVGDLAVLGPTFQRKTLDESRGKWLVCDLHGIQECYIFYAEVNDLEDRRAFFNFAQDRMILSDQDATALLLDYLRQSVLQFLKVFATKIHENRTGDFWTLASPSQF
jgi:hypothetical protein